MWTYLDWRAGTKAALRRMAQDDDGLVIAFDTAAAGMRSGYSPHYWRGYSDAVEAGFAVLLNSGV